jgi:hypothetical protein
MIDVLLGALAMACFIAALYFLRFWKHTHDRFFLFFAVSFFIQGGDRMVQAFISPSPENIPVHYLMRLFAFGLILYAFVEKNWLAKARKH